LVLRSVYRRWVFNRFIYRREWVFRIYRETLSRFSCAASHPAGGVDHTAGKSRLAGMVAQCRGPHGQQ
ncbi:hypothetical protein ABLN67_18990, partial [Mycobacterium tuberculosis]